MRIVVTGASGRLGRALVHALEEAPFTGPGGPIAWTRADFDLDDPSGVGERLDRVRAEIVVHAAAWTDVDGCAREPELALRRNGDASAVLARACAERSIDLVFVSTNEAFDGRRTDGRGYRPGDEPRPINAYGASKLAGEQAVAAAYAGGPGGRPTIVRTAWLYGPPGNDFPTKILAAAERARAARQALQVVGDEIGSPTYTVDLAEGIVELLGTDEPPPSIVHLVNAGAVSRAGWARELFRLRRVEVAVEEVPLSSWQRASTPPAWAVLEPSELPSGGTLRAWQEALADYIPVLAR
jgi:dTDP-4-dehydrorhamnose reductase